MARYTILAHAPDGDAGLLQHQDQPGDAFWHQFGSISTYQLAGDPEHEFTPPDWITQFDLLGDEEAGPEFATIDEVRQYLVGTVTDG